MSNILASHKPNRPADLIWHETDDGTVIVSPTAGKVRVLNKVGTTIWELMDGQRTVADIEQSLTETYRHVPAPQINLDLFDFLRDLTDRGLVEWQ